MPESPRAISDELLEAFLQCKYKDKLRALGRTGQLADFEKHRTSQAQVQRAQVQAKLFPLPEAALTPRQETPPALLDAATLKQGQTRLQNVRVQSANLAASIDAIERVDVPSALGCFSYRAIQYVREPTPPVTAKLLLAYRSMLLGEVQGTLPSSGVMICGPNLEPRQIKLDALEGILRDTWDASHAPAFKERLVQYNREDCQALKTVCDFISLAVSARGKPEAPGAVGPSVVSTDDVARRRSRFVAYGRATFALKDLERVSNCAYFDYQRERVFVRTDKKVAKLVRRANKKPPGRRPNQVIELTCERCVLCGSPETRAGRKVRQRRLTDLRFSASGVKRWVIIYRARRYSCAACGGHFLPEGWPKHRGYFGDKLAEWCVYQNFVCRQTMYQVVESAEELFSIRVPVRQAYLFKQRVISRYDSVHEELKQHILKSPVLCIDEGDVTLTKTKGYVWVFTTHDAAWYVYKDTRSGEFLKELLAGYSGLLVSDFYNAYDGINCPQQKCLLHLLRDVNEDLKKNPYDEEFKSIASQFGVVLRSIIDTIDKYGLKRWHLHKHKREAEAFLSGVDTRTFASELALIYQKRLKKVGSKLFTFLDYDGVPWNNNGAEHAVKSFMKFKRTNDGLFSERSLTEALVMLSILETCKLNGIRRLGFFLSGKTDLSSILGE